MSQFGQQPVRLMAGHNSLSDTHTSYSSSSSVATLISQSLNTFEIPYTIINFDDGDILFNEGEEPKGLYLLKTGCIKVFVNREHARGRTTSPEYVTKLVSPGEVFGYKALVRNLKTNSYAKAVKPSVVWLYSKDAIFSVLSQVHPLVRNVLEQAIHDIEKYEKTSQIHYLASVQERIAHQLLNLADRFGNQTPNGISINLKLTRNEFAQLASTINESLSRHLTEFKNEGLIDLNGKEIIIKNKAGLVAKSGNF